MAILLWLAAIVVILVAALAMVRFWRRTTAPRLITCPENETHQAVEELGNDGTGSKPSDRSARQYYGSWSLNVGLKRR